MIPSKVPIVACIHREEHCNLSIYSPCLNLYAQFKLQLPRIQLQYYHLKDCISEVCLHKHKVKMHTYLHLILVAVDQKRIKSKMFSGFLLLVWRCIDDNDLGTKSPCKLNSHMAKPTNTNQTHMQAATLLILPFQQQYSMQCYKTIDIMI